MHHICAKSHEATVPYAVIVEAVRVARETPEVRLDRIVEARARLAAGSVDARAIAEKILARTIGDGLS